MKLEQKYVDSYREENPEDKRINGAGVYALLIDDVVVYIGQSKRLIWGKAHHESAINDMENDSYDEHKYKLLRDAITDNHELKFKVLHYVSEDELDMIDCIKAFEIDKYKPILNYIYPAINGRKEIKNNSAYTITLEELFAASRT